MIDQHEGPQAPLNIALHGALYLAIIIDQHAGPQTPLTIAFNGGL
jgi:hypothetical protein